VAATGRLIAESRTLIASISEKLFQERERPEQCGQDQHATITILVAGWVNYGMRQQALGIDQDIALLASDFLPRIIPLGIDAGPVFRRSSRSGCR
jgi:hypothetical protein